MQNKNELYKHTDKLKNKAIDEIKGLLHEKQKKIVLVSHVNPDGDAVGSLLAFYHYLKIKEFEHIEMILPNAFPSFLAWMPGADLIHIATEDGQKSRRIIKHADIIFCLDFNHFERSDQLEAHLEKSIAQKVLIDHHPDPADTFDFSFSLTETSSTSELIYDLIARWKDEKLLNQNIAQCIYAGIVTDTGSFSYACNYPHTYEKIARLMDTGIDGEKIHRMIYDTYSEGRLRLLGYCLSERLVVMEPHKTAYIYLTKSDLKKFGYKDGDTEGVVNYALSMKNIALGVIFIERKEIIKISFRSEGDLNVNILARKYFNGGGHKNAAGGNFKDSLQNTIKYFEQIVKSFSQDNFKAMQSDGINQ